MNRLSGAQSMFGAKMRKISAVKNQSTCILYGRVIVMSTGSYLNLICHPSTVNQTHILPLISVEIVLHHFHRKTEDNHIIYKIIKNSVLLPQRY